MYPIRIKSLSHLKNVIRCGCSIGDNKFLNTVKNCSSTMTMHQEKWDLVGALVVERRPIIVKEMEEIERKFSALLQQLEFEKSLKSDHEVTDELERKQAELLKKGDLQNVDLDITTKQTMQDFKDLWKEELAKFRLSPRTTEDDKRKDQKSLNRSLDKHLLLLIEHKLGDKFHWVVPQSFHQEGEPLHQTAMRALEENCGNQLKVQLLGKVPWGFYKYKYPKNLQSKGSVGVKVFFYKATYLSGQVYLFPDLNKDFKWIETSDIFNVKPPAYSESISQFLLSCRK